MEQLWEQDLLLEDQHQLVTSPSYTCLNPRFQVAMLLEMESRTLDPQLVDDLRVDVSTPESSITILRSSILWLAANNSPSK